MNDRLSDEDIDVWANDSSQPLRRMLAREVQERRAADTRTPSFTDDEMEATRSTLARLGNMMGPLLGHFVDSRTALINYGLPDHLIDWVLGDPSPAPCDTCGGSGKLPIYVLGSVQGSSPCPSCGGEPT